MSDPIREAIETGLRFDRDHEAARRAVSASREQISDTIRRAFEAVDAAPYEPDPIHALMTERLNRLAARFHPGGLIACPVEGCGWRLAVVRPGLVESPPLDMRSHPLRFELRYEGAARPAVEQAIARHIDEAHAMRSETGLDVAGVLDPDEFARWDAP